MTSCGQICRSNPPTTGSGPELQRWVCEVHNTVNRSLGKASFNCDLVHARWGALDCGDDMACDLSFGRRH
jgi:FAD-linked sulfhydryl oxidase